MPFARPSGRLSCETDGYLLDRLRRRDPEALGDLYELFGSLAYSLIIRMVHDAGIAEDLVQETFLRVWTRSESFDATRGALAPWLLAVARNCAVDYLRVFGARYWRETAGLDEIEDPKVFADLEGTISLSAQRNILRQALGKLSSNQRAVIELAYFEGLSQTEMATKLGRPLGTVKTWVRSALKTLGDELRPASASRNPTIPLQ